MIFYDTVRVSGYNIYFEYLLYDYVENDFINYFKKNEILRRIIIEELIKRF